MGLRDLYLEAINLSFIFIWDDGKIEDRTRVSTSPLFEGLSINNTKLWDISIKNKMHGNAIRPERNYDKLENKNTYVPGLFGKPFHLTKINLKKSLSRGSRFKIHFRLECRRNCRSRQNFHGISFSKTVY